MQIQINIEMVCAICGKPIPVDMSVVRERDPDRWIYKVMPCPNCASQPAVEADAERACGFCDVAKGRDFNYCDVCGRKLRTA